MGYRGSLKTCRTKSLRLRDQHRRQVLYFANERRFISDHNDAFNKNKLDLKDLNVKIDDENKDMILLCLLSSSYEHLVDTLVFERQTFIMID